MGTCMWGILQKGVNCYTIAEYATDSVTLIIHSNIGNT